MNLTGHLRIFSAAPPTHSLRTGKKEHRKYGRQVIFRATFRRDGRKEVFYERRDCSTPSKTNFKANRLRVKNYL